MTSTALKDYAPTARRAAVRLKKYGAPVQVIPPSQASNGWRPPTQGPASTEAAFLQVGYSLTNRNETTVQAGDLVGLLEHVGPTFENGWMLEHLGETFEIVDCQPLRPATTVILYEIIARK